VTALLQRAASPGAAPRGRAADLALDYADRLTRDAHGVDDAAFARLRGVYDDAQIVELTMAVCFFNHFTRMANALALTPEGEKGVPPGPQAEEGSTRPAPRARVSLASDAEMAAGGRLLASAQTGQNLVGKTVYNSQRAMVRVPDLMEAWFSYWATVRGYNALTNAEKLQVSFAVSKANGCRYCVLHQVAGLRREGVDIAKLLAMEKGDDALTPRERAAVVFARKLTARPADIARADWAALETALGRQGAMEVLLQACAFNFMNRFTDNLGLASEDEAVHTYEQVYGTGAYGRFPAAPR